MVLIFFHRRVNKEQIFHFSFFFKFYWGHFINHCTVNVTTWVVLDTCHHSVYIKALALLWIQRTTLGPWEHLGSKFWKETLQGPFRKALSAVGTGVHSHFKSTHWPEAPAEAMSQRSMWVKNPTRGLMKSFSGTHGIRICFVSLSVLFLFVFVLFFQVLTSVQ